MHVICLMKLLAAVAVYMVGVTVVQCLPSAPHQQSLTPIVSITSTIGDHNQHNQQPKHELVRRDVNKCNETVTTVAYCIQTIWSSTAKIRPTKPSGSGGGLIGLLSSIFGAIGLRNNGQINETICCMQAQGYCSLRKVSLDGDVCSGDKLTENIEKRIDDLKVNVEDCQQSHINATEQLCKPKEMTSGGAECTESAKYLCYGELQPVTTTAATDKPNPGSTGGSGPSGDNSPKPPATPQSGAQPMTRIVGLTIVACIVSTIDAIAIN